MWIILLSTLPIATTQVVVTGEPLGAIVLLDASDPGGTFVDDNGNVHEGGIEAIAADAITLGCNPPGNTRYCPGDSVTRGEMAAFTARALGLGQPSTDHFGDDSNSVFEGAINRIADAGITQGCDPPANTSFCPTRTMTRGEMAAFMARAFNLPASGTDWFGDDDNSIFEGAINRIADAGITVGCNPPANTDFCPTSEIKRDQMATFLTRALGLTSMRPPAVATFGPGAMVVGDDVAAGVYRNTGFADGCYWERLSGFSGSLNDIIANNFTNIGQIVEIKSGDIGFNADVECGSWTNQLVSGRQGSPSAPFGSGTYLVPEEISPGTWRSTPTDSCYWERKAGFGGELGDIVDNEFTDAVTIAEIDPADIGFTSEDGCGTWTKIG